MLLTRTPFPSSVNVSPLALVKTTEPLRILFKLLSAPVRVAVEPFISADSAVIAVSKGRNNSAHVVPPSDDAHNLPPSVKFLTP